MEKALYLLLAFGLGLTMSIYLPMNSSVSRHLQSSAAANVTFFLVALVTAVMIFFFLGHTEVAIGKLGDVPLYLYLTGFISAFFVLGTTFLIPQIGARRFFLLLLAGQIIMAIAVSHFGVLESPKDPVTLKKLAGAGLVLAGAVLSTA